MAERNASIFNCFAVKWDSIFRSKDAPKFGFRVSDEMDENVGVLRLTPSINSEIVSIFRLNNITIFWPELGQLPEFLDFVFFFYDR